MLLFAPSSPSSSSGSVLPLLARYYEPNTGSLMVEHSVISTTCRILQQWVQHYSREQQGKGAGGVVSGQVRHLQVAQTSNEPLLDDVLSEQSHAYTMHAGDIQGMQRPWPASSK